MPLLYAIAVRLAKVNRSYQEENVDPEGDEPVTMDRGWSPEGFDVGLRGINSTQLRMIVELTDQEIKEKLLGPSLDLPPVWAELNERIKVGQLTYEHGKV